MKKIVLSFLAAIPVLLLVAYSSQPENANGLVKGTPAIKSINTLAFGTGGMLFIGDSKSAVVFAVDTKDAVAVEKAEKIDIKNIDQKIAAFLGTETKNITIKDLKVNPVSKKLYCAVESADGAAVLLIIEKDKLQAVNLKDIMYSTLALNNVPAEDAKDGRGRPLRVGSIADLAYADGKVMVSGISNQEFGSTFRSIPFPFTNVQQQSSLEIYHAAHGRYETQAPIETFTTGEIGGKQFLVASYTCTPLVLFPLEALTPGTHVKGRTVAEFGAGNRPLDMITMKKGGEQFLIIANSNRAMMKVKYKDIEAFQGTLDTPIKESFATAGVPFISFPWVNVLQLDKLDENQFVYLQRSANGDLNLQSQSNQSL